MNPAELMRDAAAGRRRPRGLRAALRRPPGRRAEDPDLALLAGDRLYALGLEKLAAAGDLEASRVARARRIAAVRAGARARAPG